MGMIMEAKARPPPERSISFAEGMIIHSSVEMVPMLPTKCTSFSVIDNTGNLSRTSVEDIFSIDMSMIIEAAGKETPPRMFISHSIVMSPSSSSSYHSSNNEVQPSYNEGLALVASGLLPFFLDHNMMSCFNLAVTCLGQSELQVNFRSGW